MIYTYFFYPINQISICILINANRANSSVERYKIINLTSDKLNPFKTVIYQDLIKEYPLDQDPMVFYLNRALHHNQIHHPFF